MQTILGTFLEKLLAGMFSWVPGRHSSVTQEGAQPRPLPNGYPPPVLTSLKATYVNEKLMMGILKEQFPTYPVRVELHNDVYSILAPRELSEVRCVGALVIVLVDYSVFH